MGGGDCNRGPRKVAGTLRVPFSVAGTLRVPLPQWRASCIATGASPVERRCRGWLNLARRPRDSEVQVMEDPFLRGVHAARADGTRGRDDDDASGG